MLKEQLKINEWLELIEEDKNLKEAYICISLYLYSVEEENQQLEKELDYIKNGEFLNQLKKESQELQKYVEALEKYNLMTLECYRSFCDNIPKEEIIKNTYVQYCAYVHFAYEYSELKKQLEERKYYKFYKYENNSNGSDYCFCERPCDSNMSLKCFFENGEICGFMSESLVSNHDDIKEISLIEFANEFIKPLINTNFKNKKHQKEFIKYLENEINTIETTYSQINGNYGLMNEKLKTLEEILQKYKEIIGDDKR